MLNKTFDLKEINRPDLNTQLGRIVGDLMHCSDHSQMSLCRLSGVSNTVISYICNETPTYAYVRKIPNAKKRYNGARFESIVKLLNTLGCSTHVRFDCGVLLNLIDGDIRDKLAVITATKFSNLRSSKLEIAKLMEIDPATVSKIMGLKSTGISSIWFIDCITKLSGKSELIIQKKCSNRLTF